MKDQSKELKEMLKTNVAQQAYYNQTDGGLTSETNGFATNLWRKVRQRALVTVSNVERNKVYQVHKEWLGDLSGKKVLELGVGHGSPLTAHLVRGAKDYHALDLSQHEIDLLLTNHRTDGKINTHVIDFLDDGFLEKGFDVIYAHSVLHHFAHMGPALEKMKGCLVPRGTVISYDPLQVWLPVRLLRAAYRPFQTDADWEFPFTRQTCRELDTHFDVVDKFGVFNRAKWAMLLGILNPKLGRRFGDNWFAADLAARGTQDNMMKSLHISFHLRKR